MGAQRKWAVLSVVLLLILLGSAAGYTRWRRQQVFVETEHAYGKGSIHTVASRIPGSIQTVDIQENQKVRAGQVIVSLDPRDYDAAVAKDQVSLTEASSCWKAAAAPPQAAKIGGRKPEMILWSGRRMTCRLKCPPKTGQVPYRVLDYSSEGGAHGTEKGLYVAGPVLGLQYKIVKHPISAICGN